jgi:tetratricopeptide (TPR) repeat protein
MAMPPQTAPYGQRFASGQLNKAAVQSASQMPPGAAAVNANTRRATPNAQMAYSPRPTTLTGRPVGNEPTAIANGPQTSPTMPVAHPPSRVERAADSPATTLLIQAHELANKSRMEADYTQIIAICRQVRTVQSNSDLVNYANELCAWALNRRGQLKAAAGRDEDAIRDFDDAIAADGKRWRAFHNRGVLLAQSSRFEKAFDDFNSTVELKPDFAKAYSNRGALFVIAGNYDAASEDYAQAIQLDPKLAVAHRGMARAFHLMGDLEQAMQHYDKAVKLAPDDAYAVASRADVLTDLGSFAEAAGEYERAIKIDPQSGHAYSGSAWLLATCPDDNVRDPKLALARAKTGLELNGEGDPASFDALAAALASAGDFAGAVQNIEEAIDLATADEKAAYQDRLALYRDSVPYRLETTSTVVQASYEEESVEQVTDAEE